MDDEQQNQLLALVMEKHPTAPPEIALLLLGSKEAQTEFLMRLLAEKKAAVDEALACFDSHAKSAVEELCATKLALEQAHEALAKG